MMKADPYGNYAELRPNNASIVWDINTYQWKDKKWMDKRAVTDTKDKPLNIYEVHLGSWMRKEIAKDENGEGIILQLQGTGSKTGRVCKRYGVYPCGASAGYGASLRCFLGISGNWLLCPY